MDQQGIVWGTGNPYTFACQISYSAYQHDAYDGTKCLYHYLRSVKSA